MSLPLSIEKWITSENAVVMLSMRQKFDLKNGYKEEMVSCKDNADKLIYKILLDDIALLEKEMVSEPIFVTYIYKKELLYKWYFKEQIEYFVNLLYPKEKSLLMPDAYLIQIKK